VIKFQVIKLGI